MFYYWHRQKGSVIVGTFMVLLGSFSVGCLVVVLFEQSKEIRRLRGVCADLISVNKKIRKGEW